MADVQSFKKMLSRGFSLHRSSGYVPGEDTICEVHVFDMSDSSKPHKAVYCSADELKSATNKWMPDHNKWVNIVRREDAGGNTSMTLAQALLIMQQTYGLSSLSILDCLEGGDRVRLDASSDCIYFTLVSFRNPASRPYHTGHQVSPQGPNSAADASSVKATSAGKTTAVKTYDRDCDDSVCVRITSRANFACPTTGKLSVLMSKNIAKGLDGSSQKSAEPEHSRVCDKIQPVWERNCFFVTPNACITVFGTPKTEESVYLPMEAWFEPGASLDAYAMERKQGHDYLFYKLVESCVVSIDGLLGEYHKEIIAFERGTFKNSRANMTRDVDQTLQLHLLARELSLLRRQMTPAERCLKQILKMPRIQMLRKAIDLLEHDHDHDHGHDHEASGSNAVDSPTTVDTPCVELVVACAGAGMDRTQQAMPHVENSASGKGQASPAVKSTKDTGESELPILSAETIDLLEEVRDDCQLRQEEIDFLMSEANNLSDLMFNLTAYRSTLSGQTLAGVSMVFLPLTWVCGIYGTNFAIFPELLWGVSGDVEPQQPEGWAAGYMFFWLIMIFLGLVSTTMLIWMRIF